MAIKFASAAEVTAKKLITAQNLSNSNVIKKEAELKNEAHNIAEKIGSESNVLKISAVDEIVNNTVALWLLKK